MKNVCITLIGALLLSSAIPVNAQYSGTRQVEQALSTVKRATVALYRKPSKDEVQLLAPDAQLKIKYAVFLSQPNTGLVKLIDDQGCGENTKVLVVTDSCRKYTMPGGGSAYSFRKENYRIWRLADLLYKQDIIHAVGVRSQGILVNLGDISLENVTLRSSGVEFLRDFAPETTFNEAKEQNRELLKGITSGDFYYRKALSASLNTTYVLRSVAYRGKFYKAVRGIVYNELDYDKRRDVIIAFRIVKLDSEDESITLLWKELSNNKSPTLKVEKELVNEDF